MPIKKKQAALEWISYRTQTIARAGLLGGAGIVYIAKDG
jgi:hypothetical protein